ncbi:type II methionyl aminopeptidase [Candidatus Woesearchaeota archaeon]|nr:type II methionyl aminopeptidase [Candidatus Woesearchaeota archaeon]
MEDLDKWRKAGKITGEARRYGATLIKKNSKIIDVVEKVEEKIKNLGGECAFPVNTSLNDCAAHDTARPEDERIFTDEVVKLDLGVHVDGCIGDTAVTVDLSGKHEKLLKASEEALKAAIEAAKQFKSLGEIGRAIQESISKYGFAPVRNLSGHGLSEYNVHTSPSIPNYDTGDKRILEKETIIAIEPFASMGKGEIYESGDANIFSQVARKGVRNPITRNILKEIEKYKGLPFSLTWLVKKFTLPKTNFALRELMNLGILKGYPPLIDKAHGTISQKEHTLYIGDEVEVLTK